MRQRDPLFADGKDRCLALQGKCVQGGQHLRPGGNPVDQHVSPAFRDRRPIGCLQAAVGLDRHRIGAVAAAPVVERRLVGIGVLLEHRVGDAVGIADQLDQLVVEFTHAVRVPALVAGDAPDTPLDIPAVPPAEANVAPAQVGIEILVLQGRLQLGLGGHLREHIAGDRVEGQRLQMEGEGIVTGVPGQVLALQVNRRTH